MRGISEGRCNMSAAYDAFYWYDRLVDEDYLEQMKEEEKMANKIEIDLDAITQQMDDLKKNEAEYKFLLKQTQDEIEKLNLKLIAVLDQTGVESMDYGCFTFGWKTSTRTAFDQKLFSEQYEDLYNQFKISKENRTFQFKINR